MQCSDKMQLSRDILYQRGTKSMILNYHLPFFILVLKRYFKPSFNFENAVWELCFVMQEACLGTTQCFWGFSHLIPMPELWISSRLLFLKRERGDFIVWWVFWFWLFVVVCLTSLKRKCDCALMYCWHDYQVVVVPCGVTASLSAEDTKALYSACEQLAADLRDKDIRAKADTRDNYSPGWKFNHWELKVGSCLENLWLRTTITVVDGRFSEWLFAEFGLLICCFWHLTVWYVLFSIFKVSVFQRRKWTTFNPH